MSAWYEIIVRGPEDNLAGFLARAGASPDQPGAAILGRDLDLEGSGLPARLKDILSPGSRHLVFAPAGLAEALVAGLRATGSDVGLEVEGLQEVAGARLRFSAEAFSRDVASGIRETLLSGLPPEVRCEEQEEREESDPEARGPELYTPEHAYAYRVSGTFAGPFPGILEMLRRARDLPFVKVGVLELDTRPAEQWPRGDG